MNTRLFSSATLLCAMTVMSCKQMPKPTSPGFSGRDLTGTFEILRSKETTAATLKVRENTKWELYAGRSVDGIDFSKPIAGGEGAGDYAIDIPAVVRSYFQLVTAEGSAILAERHLPVAGGYNFRDMGGFRTQDGRYTKWGKVFRSDDMQNLTHADLHYLASIPLVSIVDFRSTQEIEAGPDKLPESVKGHYLYSIMPGNLRDIANDAKSPSVEGISKIMETMNELLVTDRDAVEQYRKFFALLQNEENTPLLFHCSAGKDRTGMAAALFLSSLSVDEHTIMDDYLASNEYLGNKYAAIAKEDPGLKAMFEVRSEFLQAGFDKIRSEYGSVDKFLTGTLAVDLEKIKEMYLY